MMGFKFELFDISKAFYKVWYKGLIFKLKQNGVVGNSAKTFLNTRKQSVYSSIWSTFKMIKSGSRGSSCSILALLLF